jgi:hypothetical protein
MWTTPIYSSNTLSTSTLALLVFFPNFNILSRFLTLPTRLPTLVAVSGRCNELLRLTAADPVPCCPSEEFVVSFPPSNPESVTQSPSPPSPLSEARALLPTKKLRLFSLLRLRILLESSLLGLPLILSDTGGGSCLFLCKKLRRPRSCRVGRVGVSRIDVSVVWIVPFVCEAGSDCKTDVSGEIAHAGTGVKPLG